MISFLANYGNILHFKENELFHIKIITTGGTIDKVYFDQKSEFQIGEPSVSEILEEARVSLSYDIISVLRKDSLDMTDKDRQLLFDKVASCKQRHIVITHGTDTMIDTARVLQQIGGKIIVLTGSIQPARFRFTDAVFNIGCAITAVQLLSEGVYLTMNGQIFDPENVRKNMDKNRFEPLSE